MEQHGCSTDMVNLTLSDPGARVGGQHAAETETGGVGGGLEGDGSVGGAAGRTGCGKPGAREALPRQPTQQTTGEGNVTPFSLFSPPPPSQRTGETHKKIPINSSFNTVEPLLYDHPQNHIGVVV